MSPLAAACVWLPMSGAVAAWLLSGRAAMAAARATALLTATAVAALAWTVGERGGGIVELGGQGAPLGIEWTVDGLAVWMLLLTAVVNVAVGVQARPFFGTTQPTFWPLWLLLWGGLNGLYLSADLFNLYVTLELVSLAAVALVTLAREPTGVSAALRYLLAAMVASIAYLLGAALVYGEHGTLALAALAQRASVEAPEAATLGALTLLTLGLLLKTAIFPFHFWLPQAHAAAPAPVSALLSALVVKASFYLLLRLWVFVFPDLGAGAAAPLLASLGALALLYGSVQALLQSRLKPLIAYSTVAQLGYLVVALPLMAGTTPALAGLAYQGVGYHLASHALVKAALFLATGAVLRAYGHDRLEGLRGMANRLPVASFVVALAAASLIGLPPSGGFVAKWWLLSAAFGSGQFGALAALLGGGLLTALYMFRLLALALRQAPPRDGAKGEALRLSLPALVLGLVAVAIGLRAVDLVGLLWIGAPFGAPP